MKKKKFNLLLQIATLCLCVAAIAFGVYSAKNASLNVSGTVGFTAHNVKAKVEAWISGFATTADGAPVTGKEQITADGGLLLDGADASFNLGATKGTGTATRYFSDLGTSGNPEDIVVEIKITSMTTAFNVLASVDFANSKATTDALKDIIKVDCDRSAAVLGTTAGTTEATFTFTISLLPNPDGSYGDASLTSPSASNIQIMMNLEKTDLTQTQIKSDAVAVKEFTTAEKEAIKTGLGDVSTWWKTYSYSDTILCYAERFPYYVEMGEHNSTKLRWLIVGTSADDGTITSLSEEDRTALSKGLMLNKTYVILLEKMLLVDTDRSISFQNQYTNSGKYLNDYGYSAQDYATSNIRQYLTGNTVKNAAKLENGKYIASGTDVNIMTKYNIDNDPMYEKIKARSLTSLYNESAISGETSDMLTVPTSKDGYTAVNFTGDTLDKLWLLSITEMEEIFKADYITGSREDYSYPLYMSSRTSVLNASSGDAWWLRSPYSDNVNSVRSVRDGGNLGGLTACNISAGVRPAFLF